MWRQVRDKIRGSIFVKFLLVFVVTGVFVIALISFFFHFMIESQAENLFEKNLTNYLHYIMKDLGSPPELGQAQKIAQTMFLQIRYESPNLRWSTSDALPTISQAKKLQAEHGPQRRHYLILPGAEGEFLFYSDVEPEMKINGNYVLIFCLTVVFFSVWLWVRWLLKPITQLTRGVNEVGRGNLAYRVQVKRNDELGHLAQSFNAMTQRIREMIHAKAQLLLDVSHEFRTPLTRIKLALEFIPNSKNRASIQEDVAELESMLEEILESGRIDSQHGGLNQQPTHLAKLIKTTVAQYNVHPRFKIKYALVPAEKTILLDPERIRKTIKNILENARKYSPNRNKPIEITAREEADALVVGIRDHGRGIPEKELPYVFEPFYRVDRSRSKKTGGFGLGLSLCKRIMEAHGGCITIQSRLNQGTTVELHFVNAKLAKASA